jgi:hypothetical protein
MQEPAHGKALLEQATELQPVQKFPEFCGAHNSPHIMISALRWTTADVTGGYDIFFSLQLQIIQHLSSFPA